MSQQTQDERRNAVILYSQPGHDRDCALAMLNQARVSRLSDPIDDIQVEHLLSIGYTAGRAFERTQTAQHIADALIRASNDIVSARAGSRVATPRMPLTPQRISKWLRDIASTYRPKADRT